MTPAAPLTTGDILLADILEHPEDDTPRMVYADWLEDYGKAERADFIRIQCEMASIQPDRVDVLPDGSTEKIMNPRWWELWRRETELVWRTALWGSDLPLPARQGGRVCTWTRGFVSSVKCKQEQWLKHGREIVRQQPVTRVELSDKEPYASPDNSDQRLWVASVPGRSPERDTIDQRLYGKLTMGTPADMINGYRWYVKGEDPIADLSNACLLHARETPSP